MDLRVKILIEGVRRTHTPVWWLRKYHNLAETDDPWCVGCEGLVSHTKCPVLQAAKELEEEDGDQESS